ncbi:NDxxF motif lipoprotein [Macrococcus brunensis]|uniref:NDxxF motif lipoprotein n=1 Tax=Macrococcus brunensis TaxID=198483 RepID=UPI001EF04C0C|nr:NDxxF motif lipoprotein [Macrococcus brunensis]ULG74453.1 NDxxF motif lipoprotein [Macrococcus brunensis]
MYNLPIKEYLDLQKKMLSQEKVIEKLSAEKISDEDQKKIKNIIKNSNESDKNFNDFVTMNTLPNQYKGDALRISSYISSSNSYVLTVSQSVDDLLDNTSGGQIKNREINKIIPPKNVNAKEQKKIEKFLEKENITTEMFKK